MEMDNRFRYVTSLKKMSLGLIGRWRVISLKKCANFTQKIFGELATLLSLLTIIVTIISSLFKETRDKNNEHLS